MYKQVILLSLLTGMLLMANAQSTTDTIKVSVNGQTATIENNGLGKKTTLTFEDSLNVFQVSVIKFGKNNKPAVNETPVKKTPEITRPKRTTRWFGEGSIGLIMYPSSTYTNNPISGYGYGPYAFNNHIEINTLNSAKLHPGVRFELFIKEKRRTWGKNGFYFITGSRLQYNFTAVNGYGAVNTYQLDSNQMLNPDSLLNSYASTMKAKFINIKFCIPLLIEKQMAIKDKTISFQTGILVGVNSNFSTIKQTSGDINGPSISSRNVGYDGSPLITVQPTFRVLYNNKLSFNFTYDLNRTNFGFGTTRSITSHSVCFSLGYRFY